VLINKIFIHSYIHTFIHWLAIAKAVGKHVNMKLQIVTCLDYPTTVKVSPARGLYSTGDVSKFGVFYFKTLTKCTLVFIDCPSSVTITSPAGSSFSVGYVLTCESDGYPEPSYTWTDSDGVVVSTASTVTIQNPGPFTLNCTAEGNFTTTCSASSSVSGNSTGKIQ